MLRSCDLIRIKRRAVPACVVPLTLLICHLSLVPLANAAGTAAQAADGIPVTRIDPASPASAAGLRVGDRVLSLGGKAVASGLELTALLTRVPAEEPVELQYARAGQAEKARLVSELRCHRVDPSGFSYTPRLARPEVQNEEGMRKVTVHGASLINIFRVDIRGAELTVEAKEIKAESTPARGAYPGWTAYHLAAGATLTYGTGLTVSIADTAHLFWTSPETPVALQLSGHLRYPPGGSRWSGWGMVLWDPEWEQRADERMQWQEVRWWGLGVSGQPFFTLPEGGTRTVDLAEPGARILGFPWKSPVEAAGLRIGDLVTMADHTPIRHPVDLQRIMEASLPGQRVRLRFVRGKQTREAVVLLEAADIPHSRKASAGKSTANAPRPVGGRDGRMIVRLPARSLDVDLLWATGSVVEATGTTLREWQFKSPSNGAPWIKHLFQGGAQMRLPASGVTFQTDGAARLLWTGERLGLSVDTAPSAEELKPQ